MPTRPDWSKRDYSELRDLENAEHAAPEPTRPEVIRHDRSMPASESQSMAAVQSVEQERARRNYEQRQQGQAEQQGKQEQEIDLERFRNDASYRKAVEAAEALKIIEARERYQEQGQEPRL